MPFCFYTIIFKSHKNFGYCECIYIFFSYKNLQFSIYKFQSHFNFKTISIHIISKNNLHPFFFFKNFYIFTLINYYTIYISMNQWKHSIIPRDITFIHIELHHHKNPAACNIELRFKLCFLDFITEFRITFSGSHGYCGPY